jgi:cell wall-associated NlpC family hydrolase
MGGTRLTRIALLCVGLALASPAAFAAPDDDQASGPEAAPAQGGDPQALDQAVWEELKRDLGLTVSETGQPATSGLHVQPALAVAQTPTAPQQAGADVLREAKDFYRDLMKRPSGLPPGVVANFELEPAARQEKPEPDDDPEADLPDDSENAGLILDLALRYKGVPYRWGGANRGGVDCSGLIIRAAADGGKPGLPHSAAELWKIGTPVAKEDLQAGDLVFFRNTYKPGISHVGIFVGGTKFLHASSRKKRVTTGNLAEPYFVRHWAGARRWDFLTKKEAPAKKKTTTRKRAKKRK